jgi:hypothetical protein
VRSIFYWTPFVVHATILHHSLQRSEAAQLKVVIVKRFIVMALLAACTSVRCEASSPHPPVSPHPPSNHQTGFLIPTAAVVNYNAGKSTGLSAVFNSNLNAGDSAHLKGYVLTGGKNGQVGWNIPTVAGGDATLPQFIGAQILIASSTNFTNGLPFKIVVQTADGVNHTCKGNQGAYTFTPAQSGFPAFSSFQAVSTQFTPLMQFQESIVLKTAFIYTGNGTVAFCAPVVIGGLGNLTPDHFSFSMTPDSKFNFQK